LGGGGGGGDHWIPKSGDFAEYTFVFRGVVGDVLRYTVTNVSDTTMTMNTSLTTGGLPPYYSEETVPKNQTVGYIIDPNNPQPGYTVAKVGTENLNTRWGFRSCDHYQLNYSEQGYSEADDLWIGNGLVLKVVQTIQGQTCIITLSDTNILKITLGW
jgi:hypothetical protein